MENEKSQVVIMGCDTYDNDLVYEKLKAAIELLGGIEKFIDPGENILLKPNLLRGKNPEASVTTHPVVFEAMIRIIKETDCKRVYYGDSPGHGSTSKVAKESGLAAIAEKHGVPLKDFSYGRQMEFPLGIGAKKFDIAESVLESDAIISLSKMKTHGLTRITGAIKNQFGCIYGIHKLMLHAQYSDIEHFSKMLVDLNRYLIPKLRLFVMDGIVAMEGNGPASGKPVPMKVLLVSNDPVALDATFARMVNLDPTRVETIRYGEEFELGFFSEEHIEFLGEPIEKFYNPTFDVTRTTSYHSLIHPATRIKDFFIQKPVVDKDRCIACGICVKSCPLEKKAIKMVDRTRRSYPIYFYNRCIRCYCCQEMCPEGAISVKTPVLGQLTIYRKQ